LGLEPKNKEKRAEKEEASCNFSEEDGEDDCKYDFCLPAE